MNHWQATFLGLKQLPRELSGFEIEAFFTFTASERALIEGRRGPSLKLGLALQIGFLRMSGRVLDAVRIVPPSCGVISASSSTWRHRIWPRCARCTGAEVPSLNTSSWPVRCWVSIG